MPLDGTPLPSPSPPHLQGCVGAGRDGIPLGMVTRPSPRSCEAVSRGNPGSSTNGSNSSPVDRSSGTERQAVRARAFALRSGHRRLVGDLHDSLACCGSVHVPFRRYAAADGFADYPMAVLSVGEAGASYGGVTRCGSPWACPVCAPRISSARAQTLAPQVASLMAEGWSAWLVTLTVRHERGDDLAGLLKALGKAWGRVTSGKRWAEVAKAGKPLFVRGFDVTHSEGAGWHPHLHVSLYLPPVHGDGREVAGWLVGRWRDALAALGMVTSGKAQDAQPCRDAVAAAKYATTPAACYETVAMAMKRARGAGSGRTPFELLEAAVGGDARASALWREYVAATKGKRQVTVSRGLHLKEDAPDLEPVEEVALAELGQDTMRELDRRRLAAPLLDVAEGPRDTVREAVRAFLVRLGTADWCVAEDSPPPLPADLPSPPLPAPVHLSPRERERVALYEAWKASRAPCPAPCSTRAGGDGSKGGDAPRPDTSQRPSRAAEGKMASQGTRLHGAERSGAEEAGVEAVLPVASTVAACGVVTGSRAGV